MSFYTQEQRWDHQRDLRKHESSPRHQKRALQELVAYCHGLLSGGLITMPEVQDHFRARVNTVCAEFDIDKLPPAPRKRHKADPGECLYCDSLRSAGNDFHPSHDASPRCESGKRNHCSCDVCF